MESSPAKPARPKPWAPILFLVWATAFGLLLKKQETWPFHPTVSEITGTLEAIPDYPAEPIHMPFGKFYFSADDGRRFALTDTRLESAINLEGEETVQESGRYSIKPEHRYRLRGVERSQQHVFDKIKDPEARKKFRDHVQADSFFNVIEFTQLN